MLRWAGFLDQPHVVGEEKSIVTNIPNAEKVIERGTKGNERGKLYGT